MSPHEGVYFLLFFITMSPQPYSNLATTLQQGCSSFNSMVFASLWQPCSKVVVDNLATGLQQGCSKLVTLVWVYIKIIYCFLFDHSVVASSAHPCIGSGAKYGNTHYMYYLYIYCTVYTCEW